MLWAGLSFIVIAVIVEMYFGRAKAPWNWANRAGKAAGGVGFLSMAIGAMHWAWMATPH